MKGRGSVGKNLKRKIVLFFTFCHIFDFVLLLVYWPTRLAECSLSVRGARRHHCRRNNHSVCSLSKILELGEGPCFIKEAPDLGNGFTGMGHEVCQRHFHCKTSVDGTEKNIVKLAR